MRFEYAEDGPPADLKIIGYGESWLDAVDQVGRGMMNAVVPFERMWIKGRPHTHFSFIASGYDELSLLYDYFEHLISIIEDEGLVGEARWVRYTIDDDNEEYKFRIFVDFVGCKLDREKHKPETNIKAVTFHQMALEDISDAEHGDCWKATVVFDL